MDKHDVVVVGAGGAGLTAAVTLARAGVDILLIEKRPAGSPQPRATVLSLRTMEVMRSWGLEGRVLAGADDVEMTMMEAPTAARAAEGTPIIVGYPSPAQSSVVSPTEAACVAQDHLEAVLAEHLSSLPSATIERGVELVGLAETADGVTVTVREDSGRLRTLLAGYVVGADGSRSAVRSAVGIEMNGPDDLMAGLTVEFRSAGLWDVLGSYRHLLYVLTDLDPLGVLLPAGQGDRWLLGGLPADDESRSLPSHQALRERILEATGVPDLDVRIERVDRWASGAQMAERFSRGNVYLVGDAAHRVTPRGGTGLNIAIADGVDLGWKLGWVCRGWADRSLLSTYEAERRPAVAHNVARSTDEFGSRRAVVTELAVDLGGRIGHVWIEPFRVSTLDMIGDGLTLFVAGDDSGWADAARRLSTPTPIGVEALDALTARSLGVSADGALLVRPDGIPVVQWASSSDAEDQLRSAVSALTGRLDEADVVHPKNAA